MQIYNCSLNNIIRIFLGKMEFEQLDEAVSILESTISEFPIGVCVPDDFKPIEDKITTLRDSLRVLSARKLTLNALIDSDRSEDLSEDDLNRSMDRLNQNTSNYLINTNALKLCSQSKAIQDIIFNNAGSPEFQERAKKCLNVLFSINDRLIFKTEKKKQLLKRQYQLRLDCHDAIYKHQDFLKEREARRNQQLEQMNPSIVQYKEKINKSILKINTMKRLVTNLIASMCKHLYKNEDLVEMLVKHKEIINLEKIVELAHGQSLASSDTQS